MTKAPSNVSHYQRRHYEDIAAQLKDTMLAFTSRNRNEAALGVREVALVMARRFENDNPRFDRVRFLEACGLEA